MNPIDAPAVHLKPGQTALFGYGSLLSIPSLERTLGGTYTGPFVPCRLSGWRRSWDAALPNRTFYTDTPEGPMYPKAILYLNVRRERETVMNGILFVVDAPALAAFDKREWVYDRIDVTSQLDVRVEGGRAYVYVCRPEHCLADVPSSADGAVRASYVEIVENGLAKLGESFRAEYTQSSDPVPGHLVIADRSTPNL